MPLIVTCSKCRETKQPRVEKKVCDNGAIHLGLYCSTCDKWIKWASKREKGMLNADANRDEAMAREGVRGSTLPDFGGRCSVCDASPVMPVTGMCGPCTTGEAATAGGNW